MWSLLSYLTSIDNDHRSCLSLADDEDEISVMHTYDTLCLQSLSLLEAWSALCPYLPLLSLLLSDWPFFSNNICQRELVDMYYLRRHFEFYLVVSKDCFHPSGDDKRSSWRRPSYHSQWWAKDFPFLNDHRDDDHFSTVTFRENPRSWHQVALFSMC